MNVKKHKCRKKPVQKELIENIVLNAAMDIFKDKALIRKISKACFDLQSKESPMLPALKRRLRENQKEIKNLMNAIKAGIVLKTTKAELEKQTTVCHVLFPSRPLRQYTPHSRSPVSLLFQQFYAPFIIIIGSNPSICIVS